MAGLPCPSLVQQAAPYESIFPAQAGFMGDEPVMKDYFKGLK